MRLSLDGVSKRFGGLAALTDVSLAAAGGEIVGFLGPNGAGKTTLFDVVSGFLSRTAARSSSVKAPTRSTSRACRAAARSKLGLGRSFQDGRLFPNLTVAETISLAFERHLETRDPFAAALRPLKPDLRAAFTWPLVWIVSYRTRP